jgi:hypothetical protein
LLNRLKQPTLFALIVLSFIAALPGTASGQQPAAPQPAAPPAATPPSTPPPSVTTPQGMELMPSGNGLTVARGAESYTNLSLAGSELHPQPPMSTGHVKNPDFEREMVRVQWRPSDPIDMYIVKPPQVKNPPVVLFLGDFSSELNQYTINFACKYHVKNGAAAVGFVAAHAGRRAEHGPLNQWFVSELPESLTITVHDVQLILNYLESRGDLDMTRVGMFGEGSGGAIAILAAATDHRLKAVDLVNPWGDWPDWLAKSHLLRQEDRDRCLKAEFLQAVGGLDPVDYLPKLAGTPVRMQFVDDELTDTKDAVAKLEKAAPASAHVIHYPGFQEMYAANANGKAFEWIATTLKSAGESKQVAVTVH